MSYSNESKFAFEDVDISFDFENKEKEFEGFETDSIFKIKQEEENIIIGNSFRFCEEAKFDIKYELSGIKEEMKTEDELFEIKEELKIEIKNEPLEFVDMFHCDEDYDCSFLGFPASEICTDVLHLDKPCGSNFGKVEVKLEDTFVEVHDGIIEDKDYDFNADIDVKNEDIEDLRLNVNNDVILEVIFSNIFVLKDRCENNTIMVQFEFESEMVNLSCR